MPRRSGQVIIGVGNLGFALVFGACMSGDLHPANAAAAAHGSGSSSEEGPAVWLDDSAPPQPDGRPYGLGGGGPACHADKYWWSLPQVPPLGITVRSRALEMTEGGR
jgi:hypothetical protein